MGCLLLTQRKVTTRGHVITLVYYDIIILCYSITLSYYVILLHYHIMLHQYNNIIIAYNLLWYLRWQFINDTLLLHVYSERGTVP